MVAVEQPCPLVEFPSHAPSCSPVTPVLKHYTGGLGQLGRGERTDGVAGMQTEEMIHMAVVVVGVVDVSAPLHQLAVASYGVRCQMIQHILPLGSLIPIHTEHLGSGDGVEQNLACHRMAVGGSLVHHPMLG